MLSFMQNYEQKVNGLKKTIIQSKQNTHNNFLQNKEIVKQAIDETKQKYSAITNEISEIDNKIRSLSHKQLEQQKSISKGLEIDDLKINQKLNVDGIIYSKKLNTKGINLPNIQITPQGIKVTGDTKIQT